MRNQVWALVCALVAVCTLLSSRDALGVERADVARTGTPAFHFFTDRDGLPQNTISSIAFDARGCAWVGSTSGLASYCGRAWNRMSLPPGTRSDQARSIAFERGGAMWVGTPRDGVLRYEDGRWSRFDATNALLDDSVHALLVTESSSGARVWVGTDRGLARYAEGRWTTFDAQKAALPDMRVRELAPARSASGGDAVWIGTDHGLTRYEDGAFRTEDDPSAKLSAHAVRAILETTGADGGDVLWVGTTGGGLRRREHGRWTSFDVASGALDVDFVMSIAETRRASGERTLWVGTDGGGLTRYARGAWRTFETKNSPLAANFVSAVRDGGPDDPSTLWIATLGGGVGRLREGGFLSFTARDGSIPDGAVFPLAEVWDGGEEHEFWVGTENGVGRFRNGAWSRLTKATSPLPDDNVNTMAVEDFGTPSVALWLATARGDLARVAGDAWSAMPKAGPGTDSLIFLFLTREAGERVVWATTAGSGLGRLAGGRWTLERARPGGLPGNSLGPLRRTVTRDGKEALWVGGAAGLARRVDGVWTTFSTSTSALPSDSVQALTDATMPNGVHALWIATGGGGLSWIDLDEPTPRFTTLNARSRPPLPSDLVYGVEVDAAHRVYAFTSNGVARLTPRAPTGEDPAELRIETFTVDDGLPSNECGQAASMIDSRGRVWVGTAAGAAILDPRDEEPEGARRVVIEAARAGERPLGEGAVLRHDENGVALEFALASYHREAETRYRFELVGLDQAPSAWSRDGKANYTNLGPGSYTFRVWARDFAGTVAGPSALTFRVKAAPWRTGWAYTGYALAVLLAGYAAYRARVAALRAQNARLEEKVEERTRELDAKNAELEERDARIREDLTQAERFQRGLLPDLPEGARASFTAVYRPTAVVGGDLYDVAEIAPHRFRMFIADATGHGVQASLRTMVLSTEYEKVKRRADRGPGAVMTALNGSLTRRYPNLEMQCSACCVDVSVDADGGATVTFSNAAHPTLLTVERNQIREHGQRSPYMAMIEDYEFEESRFRLHPGGALVLLTDGVSEQPDGAGVPFGDARVHEVLVGSGGLAERVNRLVEALSAHGLGERAADDVTILGVELTGIPAEPHDATV